MPSSMPNQVQNKRRVKKTAGRNLVHDSIEFTPKASVKMWSAGLAASPSKSEFTKKR